MADKCETELVDCHERPTFRYRWPGTLFDAHVCDRHMLALADAADPLQLDVRPIGSGELVAHMPPGADEVAWKVVRDGE